MTLKDKNRKNKKQMKIWTSKELIDEIDSINSDVNNQKNLNQLSGLNRSKIVNTCFNLYINDSEFRKMIIDIVLKGE